MTGEQLAAEGHELYLRQEWDRAEELLEAALAIDSSSLPVVKDLASLHYERATFAGGRDSIARRRDLAASRKYFARLEAAGVTDADVYERLCETSVALGDAKGFLRAAKAYARQYPYDRQYYNLGLAQFGAGEYQETIRSQKEAIEKFPRSEYIGGFYRQLGHAYMKVDRDQTADRTLSAGLNATHRKMSELGEGGESNRGAYERLSNDKIAILLMLKKICQTYKFNDRMEGIDRQLKEAGYRP
jgi:tetratricopeptide (TPR) repeat protein